MFKTSRLYSILALAAASALVGLRTPDTLAQGPPSAGELAAVAATLPPLAALGNPNSLPLAADGPLAWRGVRDGIVVSVDAAGGLGVGYTVTAGTPAGVALLVRPGTFANVASLKVRLRGDRNANVVVSLQDGAGVTYAFPSTPVRAGAAREHTLDLADLTYLAPASSAPDPGSFDPAGAILVTVLDLAGFMGGAEVATGFVLEAVDLVHGASAATSAPAAPSALTAPAAAPEAAGAHAAGEVGLEAGRHPAAVAAERTFFATFNEAAKPNREAPLRDLMIAWLSDPTDGRTALLLGLNHLWIAAEGDHTNPRVVEHLLLSEQFLARAQELAPSDRRIPSWLVPVRLALADLEQNPSGRQQLVDELLAVYQEDPDFHSFSVAMLGYDEPIASPEFARGLTALRVTASAECLAEIDPTCTNAPRWPHNLEGYYTFAADYELKAGHATAARAHLEAAKAVPSFATWPLAAEVDDRLVNLERYVALYGDADRGNDPPSILSAGGSSACGSCHRNGSAR